MLGEVSQAPMQAQRNRPVGRVKELDRSATRRVGHSPSANDPAPSTCPNLDGYGTLRRRSTENSLKCAHSPLDSPASEADTSTPCFWISSHEATANMQPSQHPHQGARKAPAPGVSISRPSRPTQPARSTGNPTPHPDTSPQGRHPPRGLRTCPHHRFVMICWCIPADPLPAIQPGKRAIRGPRLHGL